MNLKDLNRKFVTEISAKGLNGFHILGIHLEEKHVVSFFEKSKNVGKTPQEYAKDILMSAVDGLKENKISKSLLQAKQKDDVLPQRPNIFVFHIPEHTSREIKQFAKELRFPQHDTLARHLILLNL